MWQRTPVFVRGHRRAIKLKWNVSQIADLALVSSARTLLPHICALIFACTSSSLHDVHSHDHYQRRYASLVDSFVALEHAPDERSTLHDIEQESGAFYENATPPP